MGDEKTTVPGADSEITPSSASNPESDNQGGSDPIPMNRQDSGDND